VTYPVAVLLKPDAVRLYEPGELDAHGWREPDPRELVWEGLGNLQPGSGRSDQRATDDGGAGPFEPRRYPEATVYLPPAAPLRDGMIVEVRGDLWSIAESRLVEDPRGLGGPLSCWVASANGIAWPEGEGEPGDGGEDA
jgi:hypothetical protein